MLAYSVLQSSNLLKIVNSTWANFSLCVDQVGSDVFSGMREMKLHNKVTFLFVAPAASSRGFGGGVVGTGVGGGVVGVVVGGGVIDGVAGGGAVGGGVAACSVGATEPGVLGCWLPGAPPPLPTGVTLAFPGTEEGATFVCLGA